jgi:hypothetical protein
MTLEYIAPNIYDSSIKYRCQEGNIYITRRKVCITSLETIALMDCYGYDAGHDREEKKGEHNISEATSR